ncbi:hypothetical protein TMS3_0104280 [Pseudomonas taeanensis MS-3]|jgi:uncharacterized protein (TIGR02444 family)|uniref:TIGR02444 family protein n=1 Tax=Pseudomonas taeanensis MS-3 TaxID=1395571 RepID=A0A0A1YML0_9PSED|nr:TIGR02444 family protein [Pseudomonas taeanensis]KFX71157.1 hypothetical protein TMS3_0104280 [Pseudomonas taeanensis MS-3]
MPSDLWRFAENFYQRPGVENACLHLQAQGADVCLLICAAWLDRRNVAFSRSRAEQLSAAAQPWQREVVGALRQIRQAWRKPALSDPALTTLREQVKRLELDAERVQLERLASLSADWPSEDQQPQSCWLDALTLAKTSDDHDALEHMRAAARMS